MERTTWKGEDMFINIPTILKQYPLRQDRNYKCINNEWLSCNTLSNVPTTLGIKNLLVLGVLKREISGQWFEQPTEATIIEAEDNYVQMVLREYRIKTLPI